MKAGMEYGFLLGVVSGLGATIPAVGPVVLGLLTLHFSWGILRMGPSRLWLSGAGTLLFLVGIWLVWPLEAWSNAIRSGRLVLAIIAMVGGLLLYWAQRRQTPRFREARTDNTLGDLLLFRWVRRSSRGGS